MGWADQTVFDSLKKQGFFSFLPSQDWFLDPLCLLASESCYQAFNNPEFWCDQQKFQRRMAIFIKLLKKCLYNVHMFVHLLCIISWSQH
jgi:hypothetical protein